MWELQSRDLPYERIYTRKDEGLKKYSDAWMKCQLIDERAGEIFSEYTLGPHFIDFCRGPHVPAPPAFKAFKLLFHRRRLLEGRRAQQAVAAHLRQPPSSLKRISTRISSRSKRPRSATNRKLGRELDLFSASRSWPARASSSFTPRAASSASSLKTGCATSYLKRGYSLVYNPPRGALRAVEDPPATPVSTPRNMFSAHGAG